MEPKTWVEPLTDIDPETGPLALVRPDTRKVPPAGRIAFGFTHKFIKLDSTATREDCLIFLVENWKTFAAPSTERIGPVGTLIRVAGMESVPASATVGVTPAEAAVGLMTVKSRHLSAEGVNVAIDLMMRSPDALMKEYTAVDSSFIAAPARPLMTMVEPSLIARKGVRHTVRVFWLRDKK